MSDTRYDPFEDTGDWPFREAPPRPEPVEDAAPESLFAALGETAIGPPDFDEEEEKEQQNDALPDEVASEDVARTPAVAIGEPAEEPSVGPEQPDDVVAVADEAPEQEPGLVRAEEAAVLPAEVVEEQPEPDEQPEAEAEPVSVEHAPGAFVVPPGPEVLEGGPHGFRRNVAVVVSRFNGDLTSRMLEVTIAELRDCHVGDEAITVVPVPGAFELPLAALALAKTRRFACVVALGCVIRGETAHFDLIAGETASGLQLAAIETGIPVAFGVITCEDREQAEARIDRAAEAARTALEMADLFAHVRTRAATP